MSLSTSRGARPARRVLILGALSTIAEETARRLATDGASLILAARRGEELEALAADLRIRGAREVRTVAVDLASDADKRARMTEMAKLTHGLDAVLLFYGTLGEQAEAQADPAALRRLIDVNFTSAAEWLSLAVEPLRASPAERPVVLAVSSVAGDRGRRSNYAYGAAKAGLSVFMQGLAHRLAAEDGPRAVLVKLGFVRSAMTAHLKTSGPLWADADVAAKAIVKAMDRGGPIVYAPWFWRWVMLAVRATPSLIFNRVNL